MPPSGVSGTTWPKARPPVHCAPGSRASFFSSSFDTRFYLAPAPRPPPPAPRPPCSKRQKRAHVATVLPACSQILEQGPTRSDLSTMGPPATGACVRTPLRFKGSEWRLSHRGGRKSARRKESRLSSLESPQKKDVPGPVLRLTQPSLPSLLPFPPSLSPSLPRFGPFRRFAARQARFWGAFGPSCLCFWGLSPTVIRSFSPEGKVFWNEQRGFPQSCS